MLFDFPSRVARVQQVCEHPQLSMTGMESAVLAEMARLFPNPSVLKGRRVAIGCGSRGVANLAKITRWAIDWLKSHRAIPVVVPAMGSHGGDSDGKRQFLADTGITEAAMACEFDLDTETRCIAEAHGVKVHWPVSVLDRCDFVFVINRIKPHTEIYGVPSAGLLGFVPNGSIHSGIAKMATVGLGQGTGAAEYHSHIPDVGLGLCGAVAVGYLELLKYSQTAKMGKFVGGLAIVENGLDQTMLIQAIPATPNNPQICFNAEVTLLQTAWDHMPSLPLDEIDVLWIWQMSKKISGTGMDTNVLNRYPYGYIPGDRFRSNRGSSVYRVVISNLREDSHGNAHGIGLADFCTERLRRAVNWEKTAANSETAFAPALAKCPIVKPSDFLAIQTALLLSPSRAEGDLFVAIPSTLHPGDALVSEAVLLQMQSQGLFDDGKFELVEPLRKLLFDETGHLVIPESWSH